MTTTEYLSTTTLARITGNTVRVFRNGELVATFASRDEMRAWWAKVRP